MARKWMVAAAAAALSWGCVSNDGAQTTAQRPSSLNSGAVKSLAGPASATYASFEDAVLAADLDALVTRARAEGAGGVENASVALALTMDAIAAGRNDDARAIYTALPDQFRDAVKGLTEAWLHARLGENAAAAERAKAEASTLPDPLGQLQVALVLESTGDLKAADEAYDRILSGMDLRAPPTEEPSNREEAMRVLNAPQVMHTAYRAALVKHRLGDRAGAQKLYDAVLAVSPNSPDVDINVQRLKEGRPPFEPQLNPVTGLGRWSLFLSEQFGRMESMGKWLAGSEPDGSLTSVSGALLAQMGLALDPSADDWTLGAAWDLIGVDAYDGATRLLSRIPKESPYAASAALGLAAIAEKKGEDDRAVRLIERAGKLGPQRFEIALSSGLALARLDADRDAMEAFSRALELADTPKRRAEALLARGGAQFFLGRFEQAAQDGRAALAADDRAGNRIAVIGLLLENPNGYEEAVALGRGLLAERPDSVARLNQLGYTLIQRPEGLEEGFRLLARGAALGPRDYAVVDSLGWAYYLYGDFEEALRLIERANELSNEPVAEILDHLGDVYWRLGQQDAARDAWRQGLEARPEAFRRERLRDKIANGLNTPAPERRPTPVVGPVEPVERSDT